MCPNCTMGSKIALCQPCIPIVSNRYETPIEYYRIKHRRQDDELSTQSSQFYRLPCAQPVPQTQLTQTSAYDDPGLSLFDDVSSDDTSDSSSSSDSDDEERV